ncbi:hypothetical protein ACJMK2_028326 [Sinanodonta woodiana]|uniref:C-type lectin domain-containing protein n=1 Tax=Sinanodonta woodiana TaxID=1069815 RepID=A0ABD3X903_SINWO
MYVGMYYNGDIESADKRFIQAYENYSYSSVTAGVCEKQNHSVQSQASGIQLAVPFTNSTEASMPRNERQRKLNRRLIIISSVIVIFVLGCLIAVAVYFITKGSSTEVLRTEDFKASTTEVSTADDFKVQCPNNYTKCESEKCGRFCYRYESNQCKSWFDARQICQNEGGDLMVPSECSYPFFREQASLNEGSCSHFWIGGRTENQGFSYVTVKGDVIPQDSSFSYWSIGQPDGGGETCLEMRSYFNNYLMNNFHCVYEEGFICQFFLQ